MTIIIAKSCCIYVYRNLLNPVMNMETVEPVVGRSLMVDDSMANVKQSNEAAETAAYSTSIQRELMDDDSYYSGSKRVHGWTPKSLLESPAGPQDDVLSSSCEVTQTGTLH